MYKVYGMLACTCHSVGVLIMLHIQYGDNYCTSATQHIRNVFVYIIRQ